MLLRIGGPYNGYKNGEVIELDDDEGQALVDALGGEPRVLVIGDLRAAADPPAGDSGADPLAELGAVDPVVTPDDDDDEDEDDPSIDND